MEMLDWSLLVTTFSKQIWPLHNSATRVTSMESPSKENPADVAMQRSCQTAGAQNRPPVQVRKHACSAKSGLARKSGRRGLQYGPGRRLGLRPVLIFRPMKGNGRFRRKPRSGRKMLREFCFYGGSSGLRFGHVTGDRIHERRRQAVI